jgi:hypothetical protein
MVGVGVGEKYCVDPLYAFTQCLKTQIRRGVNQDIAIVMLYQEGSPRPLVPWVIRRADPAAAADHRHAGGCPAPQYRDVHAKPFLQPAQY